MNTSNPAFLVCLLFLTAAVITACNNSKDIPFPEKEMAFTQPVTTPLVFTAAKKLVFDTAKKGNIRPVKKKLDLGMLSSEPYDSNGFRPFSKAPEETTFNFNALPEKEFNLTKLPSTALQFKTYLLPPPVTIKAARPAVQKGNPMAMFDLTIRENLPANFIVSMAFDKSGGMWIGSGEGIFRYDGEHIQTFLPGPLEVAASGLVEDNAGKIWFVQLGNIGFIDPKKGTISYSTQAGAPVNAISKIIKDKNGQIWISKTKEQAVVVIDPLAGTFKSIDSTNGLPNGGANDIAAIGDNMWLSTPLAGVTIINLATNKIKYLRKTDGLSSDSLRAITYDSLGRVWLGIAGGAAAMLDIQHQTIKYYNGSQGLKKGFVVCISVDDKGLLWMGKGSNQGLDILDEKNGLSRHLDPSNGLGGTFVTSCTMDRYHRMWVSTIGGLRMIEQNAATTRPLGRTNVISLMEDTVGNIWVATQKGVRVIDAGRKLIRSLDKSGGLANDFIQSFLNFKGQMWVTSNGGLDIIDPIKKTLAHMGKAEGLVNDTVYVVLKDNAGNTWLTGPSNGVDLIDSAGTIILHTDVTGGLSDDNIVDVKMDNEGLIWLAGRTGGISLVDFNKRIVQYLNNQPGLKDTCNKMMQLDKYGRMWIGTDKGVYVADKKNGILTAITTAAGLAGNRVSSLLAYNGNILAATDNKINIITAPLPGKATSNTDSSGDLWKIALLSGSEELIREVTNAWSTDAITKKGEYLWGDNGLAIINHIEAVEKDAPTWVTGISILNKPQYFVGKPELKEKDSLRVGNKLYVKGQALLNTGYTDEKEASWDSISNAYNLPVNLTIPYDKNYIQLQFAEASLGRQDITLYKYILQGIDKSWSEPSANPYTENYLNLPPGSYTFKVSSQGLSGRWNEPAVFSFTIAPPWYKTWWAYTLFALACAAVLRAYIVYRSKRLQKENKILEEKVNLRTNQLQKSIEELKATQSQLIQSEKMASLGELTAGIAHEIQNPLNFINNFSEVNTELIADMKDEIAKGNMEEVKAIAANIEANEQKINHHGKRADSIVKGMLQHSRTGNRQKDATNLNLLADEYFRLAYHGLRAKDKSFNASMKTDFDESVGNINIISQDIGRVVLNLITNAFYAVAEKKKEQQNGYEPAVAVSTKRLGHAVEVKVTDNGNGIPQKIREKIFQPFFTTKPTGQGTGLGLSLSYDIVKAHGGEIKVDSKEGEGTTFTIQLPVT